MNHFRIMPRFSASLLASILAAITATPTYPALVRLPVETGRTPKRRRTGKAYPHSSMRQQARYARQIARDQLSMADVKRGD